MSKPLNEEQKFDFDSKKEEIKKFIRKLQAGEKTTQWDNPFYKLIVGDTMGSLGVSEKVGFPKEIQDKWKQYFSSSVFYTDGVWSQRDFNSNLKRKSGDRTYNFYITVEKTKENISNFWSSLSSLDQKLKKLSDEKQSPISYKTHRLLDAFIAHNDSLKIYYYDGDLKPEIEKVVNDWVRERNISRSSRTHSHGVDKKDEKGDKRSFGEHLALYIGEELKKNIEINPNYTDEQWYMWIKKHMPEMIKRIQVDSSNVNENRVLKEVRNVVKELIREEYIIEDILSEGVFDNIMSKIKEYGKKGILTLGILSGLMNSPTFAQMTPQQQDQIKNAAQTEISDSTKTNTKKAFDLKNKFGSIINKKTNIDNKGDIQKQPTNQSSYNDWIKKAGTVEEKIEMKDGKQVKTFTAYGKGEVNDVTYVEKDAEANAQKLLQDKTGKKGFFVEGKKFQNNQGMYVYIAVYSVSIPIQ